MSTNRLLDLRLLQDQRRSDESYFIMNELPDIEVRGGQRQSQKKIDEARENIRMAGEGPGRRSFGKVDCHAEYRSAKSFRSNSPQRAEELLEIEGYGHRCIERSAAKFTHSSETKRPSERSSNPSRRSETRRRKTAKIWQAVVIKKLRAQEVQMVQSGKTAKIKARRKEKKQQRAPSPTKRQQPPHSEDGNQTSKSVRKRRSTSGLRFSPKRTTQIRYESLLRPPQQR